MFLLVTDEVSAWKIKIEKKFAPKKVKPTAGIFDAIKAVSRLGKQSTNDEVITFCWYFTNAFSLKGI